MTTLLTVAALCLVAALVLIVIELMVPSFGTVGMVAAGCMITGGVAAFAAGLMWGAIYVGLAVLGIPLAVRAGIRALPHTPVGRRVILGGPVTPGHAAAVPAGKLERLQGAVGIAVTDLRPVGTARFGSDRIDVEAAADWIDANTPIEVVRIDGMRIVVRPRAGQAVPRSAEESSHA